MIQKAAELHKNLSIFIDSVWFFERGEAEEFYEKRKIDYLDHLDRGIFTMYSLLDFNLRKKSFGNFCTL